MATSLKEFSTTAGSNTAIGSASIAENCAPSGINNGLREIIAYIIDWLMNSGTIASATTTDLGTKTQNYLSVTGTTTRIHGALCRCLDPHSQCYVPHSPRWRKYPHGGG